jgi:hypothetical protein
LNLIGIVLPVVVAASFSSDGMALVMKRIVGCASAAFQRVLPRRRYLSHAKKPEPEIAAKAVRLGAAEAPDKAR